MPTTAAAKRALQKKPDPRRQVQGRQNRAEGKEFEKRIDEAFAYCRSKGSALIDKLEQRGVVGPYRGSGPREILPYDMPEDEEE